MPIRKGPSAGPAKSAPLSPRMRLVFWLALLLLPILFFAAAEGLLRLSGFGKDYPLFLTYEEQPAYRYQNPDVAARFFRSEASLPGSNVDFFRTEKPANALRLFVLGGSSAAGYPFYRGGSFSRMLEQRLQAAYPDREVEVINTSMAAVNSYALLDFTDDVLAENPDAVLIYAGHNEFYGALGVGSTESIGPFPGVIRLYLRLRPLRVVQAVESVLSGAASAAGGAAGNRQTTLMERMVREQHIPHDSPLFRGGVRQYRSNLSRILARYKEAGVPVYIGTLASNELDHPPFVTRLDPSTDADARNRTLTDARTALASGDTTAAITLFEACIREDPHDAEAAFELGRTLIAMGRRDEGLTYLTSAKDHDQLRFRAPDLFNTIIREEAARHGAVVVETLDRLRAASPRGVVGAGLMLEHLHPSIEGYFLMAEAFYEVLRDGRLVEDGPAEISIDEARALHVCTPVDSLAGIFRIERLMAGWPFVPIGRESDPIAARPMEDEISKIAREVYYNRITWQSAMSRQWQHFAAAGALPKAAQVGRALVQEYPFHASAYLLTANLLARQQRFDEALPYFEMSNRIEPSAEAERMIGSILLNRGDRSAALPHLEAAVRLNPENVQGLYNLSGAYALLGRHADARTTLNELLRRAPDHAAARRLAASLPPAS